MASASGGTAGGRATRSRSCRSGFLNALLSGLFGPDAKVGWNEYLWPLIVINDQKLFVLNLALPALRGPYGDEYGTVLAGATLATVPVVGVVVFMQRQFIEGSWPAR